MISGFVDPATPVFTSNGWRSIESIKVGDLVVTHLGRFREVTASRLHAVVDQGMVKLTMSSGGELSISQNHRVLTNTRNIRAAGAKRMWETIGFLHQGEELRRLAEDEILTKWNTPRTRFLFEPDMIVNVDRHTLYETVKLYDLSVDQDESYVAGSVFVDRCGYTVSGAGKEG
jgi:hypothetical protein